MAATHFMQIPGITGSSRAEGHVDWIELESVSVNENRKPSRERRISGELEIVAFKLPDDASQPLLEASRSAQRFATVTIDIVSTSGTQRRVYKDVSIVSVNASSGATRMETVTLLSSGMEIEPAKTGDAGQGNSQGPPVIPNTDLQKKPTLARAVVRANASAVNERATINLRPPRFFELALPVLTGENGEQIYPPSQAQIRLTSQNGYERIQPVSAGMVTDDGFCSLRFSDVTDKNADELFTATLEDGEEKEVIFQDRRIGTYIKSARQTGEYEAAPRPGATPEDSMPHDELLEPLAVTQSEV